MADTEHASLLKLNMLILGGKVQEAVQYVKTHNITPYLYLPARCNAANTLCFSPLLLAASKGHLDLVKALIQQGFDPHEYSSTDFYEWKPIHYACNGNHVDVVRYFIEEHNIGVESLTGSKWTMLQDAVTDRHLEMVKYLVEAGVSVNNHDGDYHPLRIAVSRDYSNDTCKYLLSKGADVNARDVDGYTPLFLAVLEDRESKVKLLLSAGASTEIVNEGETPLAAAMRSGDLSIVKLLISEGADPDWVDPDGRSILHKALCERRGYEFDISYYLIVDTGVCVNTIDKHGHSPLYAAVHENHLDAVELLVNCGFNMKCERWVFDDSFVDMNPKQTAAILKLRTIASNPMSLKDTCCGMIRHVLGKSFSHKVDTLPLPQTVQSYIMLKHVKSSLDS